ncbi:MAG: sigma-54-dependent Fis family transcriptional regulator [bacterium]|nr:sigma-54-dependent Fis family transcriptional regulator [bacterium]
MSLILIVEDEKLLRWSLEKRLTRAGHTVHLAENLAEGLDHITRHRPDVALLDLSLPDGHGLDFFETHLPKFEETSVIVMTAVGQVEDAVRAMKLGAVDFLSKPVDHEELIRLVDRSVAVRSDLLEAQAARRGREHQLSSDVVGQSPAFTRILEIAAEVASSQVTSILIQGDSGTGKNVVARHIHAISARRSKPLLEVSCAAIPDQLLESELFGHERGAFTDAKSTKRGTFELASGGTVILDEVGELKLELQAKFLHFLEERIFRRVGGMREIHVDVRVMALTNRDLGEMVNRSQFRSDLFYRLSVFPFTVPPLRERREDILPLARHFLGSLNRKLGRRFDGFTREAENLLLTSSWPGNVRELRNVIERAMILEHGPRLTPKSLVMDGVGRPQPNAGHLVADLPEGIVPLEEVEREMVKRAIRAADNNQTRAAELLDISRDQLRYRLKKWGWSTP